MSGLDLREMLSSAARRHTWRRSGWGADWGGGDDARSAALPARCPPPPPPRRPAAAGGRGDEGSGGVRGRGEEGTSRGGSGARREDAAGTGRNAVAVVAGGSVTSGAERVAARAEDGRRSMDGPTLELSEMMLHAAQPWRSRCTQRDVRPGAVPPRPVAADGRGEGTSTVRGCVLEGTTRGGGRGGGMEREREVVAPARNAVAVAGDLATHGGERVAGPLVAKEKRNGGGELGTKRGLEKRAPLPPPKRRVVSAKRQFPPDFGRDSAVPLGRGRGRGGGVRPSDGAPARAVLGEKVASAGNGDSMANVHHHAVMDTVLMKSSHASDENLVAFKVGSPENGAEGAARGKGAHNGELLGKREELAQAVNLLPMRRTVSATHRFTAGCGRDAAAPLARREEGKVGSGLEVMPVDVCGGVSKEVMATDGSKHSVNQCTANIVGAVGVLDGTVQYQELEEGEVADEAYCDVESQKVVGCDSFDDSAGERHEGVVPVTSAVTEVLTSHAYDEMMQIKALQERGSDAAQETEHDLPMGGKCETILPDASPKCSFGGPSNEIVHGKRVLGSHGMKGEVPCLAIEDHGGIAQIDQELEDVEMTTGEYRVQDAQIATHVIPHESTTGRHEGGLCASAAAEDVKVMNKYKGTLPKAAAKSSMNIATGVFGDGIMRSKILSTARKVVKPPVRASHKPPLNTLHRPFSTNSASFGHKKLKVKRPDQSKDIPMKIASTSGSGKDNLTDEKALSLEDDDILKALVVHDGKLEVYLNVPSCVQLHRQHGSGNTDDRSKIRMLCRRFQFICRALLHAVEQGSLKIRRVDLAADKIIRKLPGFTKPGPTVGNVNGVEVGDEFMYRVELALVGLHRPYQGGIDTTDYNGVLVAISIVCSGGYPDELSSSGELIYTGSGGKPAGKKKDEDQKLERGNLALKNCIETKTPVRVIHGFKGQNREDNSHSRAKQILTFTYDGLYLVVDCWTEGLKGSRIFKYKLQRIPGQPELPLHIAKGLRRSLSRPGLCVADISQGKEMDPICVINDVSNVHPTSFQYISRIKYPSWLTKRHPQHHGCDCTDGCIDSTKCFCAVKNGGKIPFNSNGAIVHDKPLIFECGPSCRCHSSCHNRVSQKGMKIHLEVFRTANKGWGVRSLRSISSGSFICEYVGILLTDKEADKRTNDEYLFDISHNCDDEDCSKGRPSTISSLNSSGGCSQTMEDVCFTIDASEYGNIGRFINHSCSPNLYAQNVLWDHDDQRVPHIMFFAAENIPPLQELTYDYNYKIGEVCDLNGRVKVKDCHCGSPQCCGRLY
uniref:Histone-lysine N-methyltransferase n=1 Tax=Oryza meridionalis TaxID=40149 RepID=A0A0E0ELE0_9ORYZ